MQQSVGEITRLLNSPSGWYVREVRGGEERGGPSNICQYYEVDPGPKEEGPCAEPRSRDEERRGYHRFALRPRRTI